jgi:hypothetical protein
MQWGEILGDAMVAAALIDRLIHHATMVTLKGKSYRLAHFSGARYRRTFQRPLTGDSNRVPNHVPNSANLT